MADAQVRAWRLGGLILTLIFVGTSAFWMMSDVVKRHRTATTSLAGVTQLDLWGNVGDIEIKVAPQGTEPRARMKATWVFGPAPVPRVTGSDGALTLSDTCASGSRLRTTCQSSWVVTVPAETSVRVRADVASVRVAGIAGTVDVVVDVGDVTVAGASPRIRASADVGNVVVSSTSPVAALSATADTGDVTVTVPADSTLYDVEVASDIGSATSQLPDNNGAPAKIVATSSIGDVRVRAR